MLESTEMPGASREQNGRAPSVPDHQLLTKIGEGSYGEVWLARNVIGTGRAVKVVYRRAFDSARPFEREFNGIRKFEPVSRSHEGLVDILQVGRNDEAGYFYYVMELADNASPNVDRLTPDAEATSAQPTISGDGPYVPKTLADELARRGRLPIGECLPLFLSLAGALAHLHKHGLIHRDIKPANIIFVQDMAKLADIGLVSEVGRSDSYVGTEGYIPPEGPGSQLADIYSLGKLLYEVSTGQDRAEFPALPIELEQLERHEGLLELNAIFVKACAGDPRHRYQAVEEMQAELALLQSGKSVRRLRTIERRLARATRTGLVAGGLFAVAMAAYVFTHFQAHIAQKNYERAEGQRLRAERAEQNALEQLCNAYLAQARASRRNGLAGHRLESLEAITRAVAIAKPGDAALRLGLRNEAIAALALTDLQPVNVAVPPVSAGDWMPFDARLERYLQVGDNGDVFVRSVADNRELLRLEGAVRAPLMGMGFSRDGRYVGQVSRDGGYQVFDLNRKAVALSGPGGPSSCLWKFTPDSLSWVAGFTDGMLLVRDLETGQTNRLLKLSQDPRRFAFSPDVRAFATWNPAHLTLEIRNFQTGELVRSWPHPIEAWDIAWSPTGHRLATACYDRNCYVWDHASDDCLQTLRGHLAVAVGVSFLGSDDLLASRSWDSTLRLWDVAHGRQLLEVRGAVGRFSFDPATHRLGLRSDHGAQSDLKVFAMLGGDVTRELWERIPHTNNGPWAVAFSPDGTLLASGSPDGARIWDLSQPNDPTYLPGPLTLSVVFDPEGTHLITGSVLEMLRWPLARKAGNEVALGPPEPLALKQGPEWFLYASLTPQGCLFTTFEPAAIRGFRNGTNFVNFPHSEQAYYLATSPDGQWLAACHPRLPGVRLWRALSGELVREFPTTSGSGVTFSPDSRWLVIGSLEEFCFWGVATGAPGLRIPREQNPGVVGCVGFSRDGRLAALSLSQWLVSLVEVATGRELARLEHPDPQIISALAFNPAGTQLAVATQGHVIQLWDLRRLHRELAALKLDWE